MTAKNEDGKETMKIDSRDLEEQRSYLYRLLLRKLTVMATEGENGGRANIWWAASSIKERKD